VLPKLFSTIKKNHIPIIIAATEIIIVITISLLLLNFDKDDLLSLSEMCTYYIR
jgi:amino acid transporter